MSEHRDALLRMLADLREFERASEVGDELHEALERLAGRYILPDEAIADVMTEIRRKSS